MEAREATATGVSDAAAALAAADWVIVAAGAGFSADSGLPTYEDCRAKGIEYDDLCRSELLYEDPALFYGFWAGCTRMYRETKPHQGYAILERLLRPRAEAGKVYIYTSNVDGHFRSLIGFPLCEIHGSCEEWMCSAQVAHAAVELLPSPQPSVQSDNNTVPLEGERFARVRAAQQRLLEVVGTNKCCAAPVSVPAPTGWTMKSDPQTMRVHLTEGWPDEATHIPAASCVNWDHAPPRCSCGLPLRPCVLMFADEDAALLRHLQKETNEYQNWEDAMEAKIAASGGRLVILELGVGRRVEVVRTECEAVFRDVSAKGGEVTLVRINLDADPTSSASSQAFGAEPDSEHLICLRMTALEALQALEDCLEKLSACHQ